MRTSNGCWTCRLRRKKCDEKRPVCDNCSALQITCHFEEAKPQWMDGGLRQDEMATWLKREVKERAHRRPMDRIVEAVGHSVSIAESAAAELVMLSQPVSIDLTVGGVLDDGIEPEMELSPNDLPFQNNIYDISQDPRKNIALQGSESILLMFHLEHILPFLFPFYRPSPLRGGRAWVLDLMIKSPVMRQATLCQSSYFFSLARNSDDRAMLWEAMLSQTGTAFEVLRQALQVINSAGVAEHMHGAARIMASIMQMQRFEIAISSFNNCKAHLDAALALFEKLLDHARTDDLESPIASINACMSHLGPSPLHLRSACPGLPSAEQAAFQFSSTLLIFDDIIASTMLQIQPRLYRYHRNLLDHGEDTDLIIDLEVTVGCQNWALIEISEIAVLDAWKQQSKRAERLDVMELVHRATAIRSSLLSRLNELETEPVMAPEQGSSLLDIFTDNSHQQSRSSTTQSSVVTRVWAHAALLYLYVVVSGWQPASSDVRYHVGEIVELLTLKVSPPALLRTMVWPFCVAGCLAEPAQEAHLRGMVETLQPAGVFGTLRKALDVMEDTWRNRTTGDAVSRDLATCFRSQGDLVLLV